MLSRTLVTFIAAVGVLPASGCPAPPPPPPPVIVKLGTVSDFFLDLGEERTSLFGLPIEPIDTLEARTKAGKGGERRKAMTHLVYAHLREAEVALDDRSGRRHLNAAARMARTLRRGIRDPRLHAEMAFVEVWVSWRTGRRNAANLAARFVKRHRANRELVYLAWAIRGEVAFQRKRYRDAEKLFRFLLTAVDHPLFAFALYRIGHCYMGMKRGEEAGKALTEVVQLGCSAAVSPVTMRVVKTAAEEMAIPMKREADGRPRPASCPPLEPADASTPRLPE
jgi:hypothetical protein